MSIMQIIGIIGQTQGNINWNRIVPHSIDSSIIDVETHA